MESRHERRDTLPDTAKSAQFPESQRRPRGIKQHDLSSFYAYPSNDYLRL